MSRNRSSLSPLVNSAKAQKHSASPAANAFPLPTGTLSGLFSENLPLSILSRNCKPTPDFHACGAKIARAFTLAIPIKPGRLDTKISHRPGGIRLPTPPNATKPLSFCCVHWLTKKPLGRFPNERIRAYGPQNNGFVSFAYLTPFLLSQTVQIQGITCRPRCQLFFRPEVFRRRRYFAESCASAMA